MSEKVSAAASWRKKVCHALVRALLVAAGVHARVRGEFRSFDSKVAKGFFFFFFFLFFPSSLFLPDVLPSLFPPDPLFIPASARKVDVSCARALGRSLRSHSLLFNSSRGGKTTSCFGWRLAWEAPQWVDSRSRSISWPLWKIDSVVLIPVRKTNKSVLMSIEASGQHDRSDLWIKVETWAKF